MDFQTVYGTQSPSTPKRKEARVPAALDVRILGIDAKGKPFHQSATTLDISLSGARIDGLQAKLNEGDIVGLQSGGGKSRFKVVWVSGNRDGSYQVGLHCVEKGACPWRENLKPTQAEGEERRKVERYACDGAVSLRAADGDSAIWGTLRDVSEHGCYVQCVNTMPPGEILSGHFTINGIQISAVAEVCNSLQAVGMGLRWCDLGVDGKAKLQRVLRLLSLQRVDESSGKETAIALVNKLHQQLVSLRERMDSEYVLVDPETLRSLNEAQLALSEALKNLA